MPGLFGIVADDPSLVDPFVDRWLQVWPESRVRRGAATAIGAHGFAKTSALQCLADGTTLAVDGDTSVYGLVPEKGGELAPQVGRCQGGGLSLAQTFRGNAALLDPDGHEIQIATEWTGTFPLFTWHDGDTFAFSSLLEPLLVLAPVELDPVGISQFLTHAYTCSGHSLVRSVRRLLPGQSLRFRRGAGLKLRERSTLWAEEVEGVGSPTTVAARLYPLLSAAVQRGAPSPGACSLMMSAGWDSRLLLAAMAENLEPSRVRTLSHGDIGGRELELARSISTGAGFHHLEREITASVLDHDTLSACFERCGSAVFPHWIESSRELQTKGRTAVFSGVYGEILGGHYGETMVRRGPRKIPSLLKARMQKSSGHGEERGKISRSELAVLLGATPSVNRWYLNREWVSSFGDLASQVQDAVIQDITRLEERGIARQDHLIEAFVSEHRGSQYINAQALSARAHGNVSLPFIDRELLQGALRIPMRLRIHNRLNREMLKLYAPQLLNYPMAATLVKAHRPLFVQELSRGSRVLGELIRTGLNKGTGGRVPKARLGWVNFDFLASPSLLEQAIQDLSLDIWDKDRLLQIARRVETGTWAGRLHPLFDQLGKIFTVDFTLRQRA